ncbi:MAG: hypothetical protein ACK6DX_11900 [Acidobacteriota bacterium]
MEDSLSGALLQTRRFRLVENCSKADFILKGSIVERADMRSRSEQESAGLASAAARGASTPTSSSVIAAVVASGGSEALSSIETKRQVTLTARLVDRQGEVILALTQDSDASKGKSAFAEASAKLAREIQRKLFPANPDPTPANPDKSGYVKVK